MTRDSSLRFLVLVSIISVYLICFSLREAGAVTYNTCLQDNSSGYSLQINSTSGDYKFKRCSDGFTLTGLGSVTSHGSSFSLQHNPSDRRVTASWSTATNTGTASLQLPVGTTVITISDSNITNNNCGS